MTALPFLYLSLALTTQPDFLEAKNALSKALASAESKGFSGEVAATGHVETIFEGTLGLARREPRRAHRSGQLWPWASVTKQITAVLILQEVEAGRLSLDANVKAVLPRFTGPTGSTVTIRQLLQHTSGLPNPEDTPLNAEGVRTFFLQRGDAIGNTRSALGYCAGKPREQPGKKLEYNNCDYFVLGAILEKLNGKSYAELVQQRIAKPLKLASLRLAKDGASLGGTDVQAYSENGEAAPKTNVASYGASGALVGSARDLLALDRALLSRELLSPATTAVMWTGDASLGYAALGVWSFTAPLRGCAQKVELVERRGELGGVQVRNLLAPKLGRAVVIFTNNSGQDFGELWQGAGLTYDVASAAFCADKSGNTAPSHPR